ncbi:hypothetical protein BDN70DRAFT_784106, partial [Pholiota conissans]
LMQLRTGHIPLNGYLARFGQAATSRCHSCWMSNGTEKEETVRHFLFECPEYSAERGQLDHQLGQDSRNMRMLMSSMKHIKAVMTFVGQTHRLRTAPGEVININHEDAD